MKINDYFTPKKIKTYLVLTLLAFAFYYFNGTDYLKFLFTSKVKISEAKAIDLAENALLKTYGKGILDEFPLHGDLDDDNNWVIRGETQCGTIGCKSHSVVVVISAENGTVINIYRQQ